MTPISSKIHSTFGVKITLKRALKYRSKKYSQIGVNWGLFLLHFWSQIYSLNITVCKLREWLTGASVINIPSQRRRIDFLQPLLVRPIVDYFFTLKERSLSLDGR